MPTGTIQTLHVSQGICTFRKASSISEVISLQSMGDSLNILLLNPYLASQLFSSVSHLHMFSDKLCCKQYGPRSECSLGSILIRVISVCFHDKI